jgi:hypothetical protein
MNFYKILNSYKTYFDIKEELGRGADGIVWNYNDKAIKICIGNYDSFCNSFINLNKINYVCKIYEYNKLGEYLDYDVYYYVMEKLEKLSDDESKVFFTLLSHEDNNKKKNYTEENAIEILNKLKIGLDFDFDKVLYFFNKIMLNEINHLDISERNIMKDSCGTFKLIDFERIKNEDEN